METAYVKPLLIIYRNNKDLTLVLIMKKWLDEKINVSYKELFNLLMERNQTDADEDDDSSLPTSAFNVITDLYKVINNRYPYETFGRLNFVIGDATEPIKDGSKALICHICNDIGAWGKGFVLAVSDKYPMAKNIYMKYMKEKKKSNLGDIQIVDFDDLYIVNMIAQNGIYTKTDENGNRIPPIRYDSLKNCLTRVSDFIISLNEPISVHMPRIGCGLAGGTWSEVEKIIRDTLIKNGIDVFVYDFKK